MGNTEKDSHRNVCLIKFLLLVIVALGVTVFLMARFIYDLHQIEEEKKHEATENQDVWVKNAKNRAIRQITLEAMNETEIEKSKKLNEKLDFSKYEEDIRKVIGQMMTKEMKEDDFLKHTEDIQEMITQTIDERERKLLLNLARRKFNKIVCFKEMPYQLMTKWLPVPSKFQGVQEYLQQTGFNRTIEEERLYKRIPRVSMGYLNDEATIKMISNNFIVETTHLRGQCHYKSDKMRVSLENGYMHIRQTLNDVSTGKDDIPIIRVYEISDQDLVEEFF